jgi:uncharacterized protein
MTRVFADTDFFLALINEKDAAHKLALRYSLSHDHMLLTTCWVLSELADALATVEHRSIFAKILADLHANQQTSIVYPPETLFYQAVDLYQDRLENDWTLTDCISFVVMQHYGLKDALTLDHRFEQAGFTILL